MVDSDLEGFPDYKIEVNITYFDLEYSQNCENDYVQFRDGPFECKYNTITLHFHRQF